MKTMKIKMTDSENNTYYWTVSSVKNAYNCGGKLPRSRHFNGWQYKDHEGYIRTVEGNWLCLVKAFNATAEGYNFSHNLS